MLGHFIYMPCLIDLLIDLFTEKKKAESPDKVAVAEEGAKGMDRSMAISQGTQSFVLVKCIVLSN